MAASPPRFDDLLANALGYWPEELRLPVVTFENGSTIVEGLIDLSEEIDAAAVASGEEDIFFPKLNWAITCEVHRIMRETGGAPKSRLSREAIRAKFDDDLRYALKDAGEGGEFDLAEAQSVRAYLADGS